MTTRFARRTVLQALSLLAVPAAPTTARSPRREALHDELFREIQDLDATFFTAYNRCDVKTLSTLIAADVEFYDDRDGLEVSRQTLIDDIEKYICGKVRRELVPGTLEVYAIPGYGAVQLGAHRVCDPKTPPCPSDSMVSKFIHIWQKKDGAWKLTRVVSYGHSTTR